MRIKRGRMVKAIAGRSRGCVGHVVGRTYVNGCWIVEWSWDDGGAREVVSGTHVVAFS